jgi:hypothetical protein
MGKLSHGVQRRKRDGKFRLVVTFDIETETAASSVYRKDARIPTQGRGGSRSAPAAAFWLGLDH